jgi:CRP-like cAMP-binding protein
MQAAVSNRLLNSLPSEVRAELQSKLTSVPLPINTPLYEVGVAPNFAYFITSGIASVVADMEGGSALEVGLLGREALPGSIHLLGGQKGFNRCFMQIGGTGLQISHKTLVQEFWKNPDLHARVLQHVQYEAFTLSKISACNRFHEVEERLARWLLMVADRIESDALPLTQEFLAQMLGTRRSTVTVSAGTLQRAGLIEYHRGLVRILDRKSLENVACECYPAIRQIHQDLYADLSRAL